MDIEFRFLVSTMCLFNIILPLIDTYNLDKKNYDNVAFNAVMRIIFNFTMLILTESYMDMIANHNNLHEPIDLILNKLFEVNQHIEDVKEFLEFSPGDHSESIPDSSSKSLYSQENEESDEAQQEDNTDKTIIDTTDESSSSELIYLDKTGPTRTIARITQT